jgi:hypothetical protein
MLLPLQGFNQFLNSIFGDLSLVVKINLNALVWCSSDPTLYLSEKLSSVYTDDTAISGLLSVAGNTVIPLPPYYYDRRFTQARVTGIARGGVYVNQWVQDGTGCCIYVSTPLKIDPDTHITRSAVSTIMGFSLKDSVKTALTTYYAQVPFVVPAERIFIQSFSTGPTASGLNCAMNIPIINGKEIISLFPRSPNEITCFRNPNYHHMMLTLLNRNFPQKGCDSNSTEFYRIELESCNLDTILFATQSFETSYLKKACPFFPCRQRCASDDTDFIMLFNLERQSSNAFYADPVNSANESISLTGSPQSQGIGDPASGQGGDTYYYLNAENDTTDDEAHKNHTCPIIGIVSDAFWLFSAGSRPIYETSLSWNECFAKNFPEIFRRLAGIAPNA